MSKLVDYGDFKEVIYPEYKNYLLSKLSELGKVKDIRKLFDLVDSETYIVEIELMDFPKIQDWATETGVFAGLHINAAAGGCFIKNMGVTCRKLPKRKSKTVCFDFDLCLDSRFVGYNNIYAGNLILSDIDEFVKRSKIGFSYHFWEVNYQVDF